MDIINDCLIHFKFSLPSELIKERKEQIVSKFVCCHNLLWQFGTDYITFFNLPRPATAATATATA